MAGVVCGDSRDDGLDGFNQSWCAAQVLGVRHGLDHLLAYHLQVIVHFVGEALVMLAVVHRLEEIVPALESFQQFPGFRLYPDRILLVRLLADIFEASVNQIVLASQ